MICDNFILKEVGHFLPYSVAIISILLNGFGYCNLTQIIQFSINIFFAHSDVVTTIAIQH